MASHLYKLATPVLLATNRFTCGCAHPLLKQERFSWPYNAKILRNGNSRSSRSTSGLPEWTNKPSGIYFGTQHARASNGLTTGGKVESSHAQGA